MSRPRKTGSGRWQARYYVTEGGKSTSRSAGTFASKRDAQDAIDTELAKIRAGKWVDPHLGKITVKDWCEAWYAARKPNKRTRSFLDARILPKWGDWRLDEVKNLHVKAWVLELVAADLSPVTVRALYTCFANILTDAVHEDRMMKSPCWGSVRDGLPTVKRTKLHYLDAQQGRRLVALAPDRYKAMFHLALWTGMRWGELAALRWENVDLAAGVIMVSEAVKREDHTIGPPKNGLAREVVIHPDTAEVLRAHRRDFGAHELVFTSPRGHLLVYTNFRRNVMTPLATKLGLDWLTFHSLRHTYCSTMLESGVDALVVAKEAGHARASYTTDIYGTARHDSADVVREAITRAMQREGT